MSRVALPVAMSRQPTIRDHISFSSISLFQSCSLRYFFRYIERLPEPTVAASLLVGAGLHAGIEHHFRQLLIDNTPPSLDTLLDVFWSAWHERDSHTVVFGKGEDINSIGRLAERMFRTFQASSFAKPRGTTVGVEEELRGQVIPGVPDLLARIDLMVDEADAFVVTDFKSARSSWSDEHVGDAASQLLLYHELVKPLADGKPVRLRFAVLNKNKVPELVIHDVPVDRHQIERTKRIAERVWRSIQAGLFFPSPGPLTCYSCPYRQPCRSWKG
jgi:putative RecB family exonuclease